MDNVSPIPTKRVVRTVTMDFGEAVDKALSGSKVRREEWPDDGTYMTVHNELLSIFTTSDNLMHPMLVKSGDIMGVDWVIYTETRKLTS